MPRPVHFEIHVEDFDRAQRFYRELFGWAFQAWGDSGYHTITTGEDSQPGINGGMIRRMGPGPADGAPVSAWVCTVDVDDLDGYLERAQAAGGTIALPKMAVPGVGWLAYCKDTEGNIFGLMQPDTSAA